MKRAEASAPTKRHSESRGQRKREERRAWPTGGLFFIHGPQNESKSRGKSSSSRAQVQILFFKAAGQNCASAENRSRLEIRSRSSEVSGYKLSALKRIRSSDLSGGQERRCSADFFFCRRLERNLLLVLVSVCCELCWSRQHVLRMFFRPRDRISCIHRLVASAISGGDY